MACIVDFNSLLEGLRQHFSNDNVNVNEVMDLLQAYKSRRADWQKYCFFDPHRYTRNLVDKGNGHYNVMLLCWGPNMASSIHDHADAHCFVKVLSGELLETQYEWPKPDDDHISTKSQKTYTENGVTYMNDSLGLHRMENPSHTDGAVSLHVYIPAFAKCQIFDERTAKRSTVKFTFYSDDGVRVPPRVAAPSVSSISMDGEKEKKKVSKKSSKQST